MSQLFSTGKIEYPPKELMADVLIRARESIGKSEDDWNGEDMYAVLKMFPPEWHHLDPSKLAVKLRRLRKDKLVPKIKPPQGFVDRALKLLRDFEKNRERQGTDHLSDRYVKYVVERSQAWLDKSLEHKERCNWRCQLCGTFQSQLDVHHTAEGYLNLENEQPWHLLAVCKKPCHALADMLRSGWLHDHGKDEFGFFSEEQIP